MGLKVTFGPEPDYPLTWAEASAQTGIYEAERAKNGYLVVASATEGKRSHVWIANRSRDGVGTIAEGAPLWSDRFRKATFPVTVTLSNEG
jgi:hypothetical protein